MQKAGGCFVTVLFFLSSPFLVAQQAPATPRGVPAIVATRSEVLLDMVVTDRHGRHIKNLKPSDVVVFDNGVRQNINSFRVVSRSVYLTPQDLEAAESAGVTLSPAQARAKAASGAFNLTTLVFGTMTTGGRVLARQAADAFIRNDLGPNDYVAVYSIDANLYILQGFTRNRARLLAAVKVATGGNSSQFTTMSEATARKISSILGSSAGANLPQDGSAASGGRDSGFGAAEGLFAGMEAEALEFISREESADASRRMIFALRGIVDGEGLLPGRKSLIFLTQQLPVTTDTAYLLRSLTAASNRSHVTFYVVDPSGLNEQSDNAQSIAALQMEAGISASQAGSTSSGVNTFQANESGDVEDIQLSSRHMMMSLATETGGFELANSNDLGPWMNRIERDIQSHYELTYDSTWGDDARFHRITVKLLRRGLKVRARNGYYALPPTPTPILPEEAPLFAVLHITPAPHAFPLQQTQWFDPSASQSSVAVASEFPMGGFTFQPKKIASGAGVEPRFTAMYLVQNMQGQIVGKASQDFAMAGPLSLKQRHMIFVRHFRLPPGMYHLRTILFDPATSRSTLQTTLLDVPAAHPGKLRLSSVAVVGRMEPARSAAGPLVYHGVRLIPAVSDPFTRASGGQIAFFFKVYPGGGAAPRVTLLFRRNGKLVGRATPPLPADSSDSAVPVLSDFALSGFAPGNYEVDVVARAGEQAVFQAGFFAVE